MKLTFGQWTPDRPGIADSLIEAKNVLPIGVGYGPMPSVADFSSAASENLLTCYAGRWVAETTLFAASAGYLWRYWPSKAATITGATQANPCVITTSSAHGFRTGIQVAIASVGGMTQLNGNTYTITVLTTTTFSIGVNSTGYGAYTSGGTATTYTYLQDVSGTSYTPANRWMFTQFGSKVIAANGQNILQAWTVGSSTVFANLAGAAPTAQFVTTVRDFVVAGKTASYPNRMFWSDINDETDWTSGPASQADTQDIPDGGEIRGITGGEFGVVLLERSIVRMSYVGAPLFFQLDNITTALGCYESRSIARFGGSTYFLSDDGFYVTDGQMVKPIGAERVDRWFFANCDPDALDEISTAIDPINKTVTWCFTSIFASKQLLVYNWVADKWTHGDTGANFIATLATIGTTLEELSNQYPNIENVPASLDSRLWSGGKLLAGGVQGAKIVTFAGSDLAAELQTGDLDTSGLETLVSLARPTVDGGSATVSVATRARLDGNIAYGTPVAASTENRVALRNRGRYHRLSVVPTGNWNSVVGMEVDLVPCGVR